MGPSELYKFIVEFFSWDAERIAAFITGIVLSGAVMFFLRRFLFRGRRDRGLHKALEKEKELTQRLVLENADLQIKNNLRDTENGHLQEKVAELSQTCEDLKEDLAAQAAVKDDLGKKLTETEQRRQHLLVLARKEVYRLRAEVKNLTAHAQSVFNLDGKVWEKPVGADAPVFAPLHERRTPIIAMVNLKGGVGKTTIAANLGAALWRKGLRVLLVDLDYQGSLTSLCLSPKHMQDVRAGSRFVNRLFRDNGPLDAALNQLVLRIGDSEGFILPASEELADVEIHAMAQWLLEPQRKDVRFLLREALHAPTVCSRFDVILLDCPPRLTSASINALCCCDYVLIPVLLDKTSADAVPRLLTWLRTLKTARICADLSVLGVLANRAFPRKKGLIAREKALWDSLTDKCRDAWQDAVYHFHKVIPHKPHQFAAAASKHKLAALDPDLESVFLDLANELKGRITTHEGQRVPAIR